MSDDGGYVNAYEAKRLRRIEENRQMLQSLKISSIPRPARPPPRKVAEKATEPVRRSQRVQVLGEKRHAQAEMSAHERRRRLEIAALVAFKREQERRTRREEKQTRLRLEKEQRRRLQMEKEAKRIKKRAAKSNVKVTRTDLTTREQKVKREREVVLAKVMRKHRPILDLPPAYLLKLLSSKDGSKRMSSTLLEIDFDAFHWRCLGRQLLPVGKQHVMQELCPEGCQVEFLSRNQVKPWKNAVAIFEESEAFYSDMFREEELNGRQVVYFQWVRQRGWQDRLRDLVQRLHTVERGDERLRLDKSYYDNENVDEKAYQPLLLFLRHKEGPYVYCGRLGYLGHRPSVHALSFRWQLLDVNSFDWARMHRILTSGAADSSCKVEEAAKAVQVLNSGDLSSPRCP